ncbi:MAG: transposase [Flaviaesturariibacter sp.]|nr:transposase [Flaviaesturariibacter sp.]
MVGRTDYYPHFFTATILQWKYLLQTDKYKDIILESLRFLAGQKRVVVYGFVIMPNHIHLLWHICEGHKREAVQRDFLKYTAQQIKADLVKNHPDVLEHFKVVAKDRQYQFWERNPLSIECRRLPVLEQKLHYIHHNPLGERWRLARQPEDYRYSSAGFYHFGKSEWDFLTHYLG